MIIEPVGARTYRNTVTEEELRLATVGTVGGGRPQLNYEKRFPTTGVWAAEGKGGIPVLNMMDCGTTAGGDNDPAGTTCTIVHTEVDAVVAGPDADGSWRSVCAVPGNRDCPYPLERELGKRNPAYANRLEGFRDFAQVWHDEVGNAQAYPGFYNLAGFIPPNPACTGAPNDPASISWPIAQPLLPL